MEDLELEIKQLFDNQEYDKALELVNKQIVKFPEQSVWLALRGDIYYVQQLFAKALNDYNKVLKFDVENKLIASKVEMISNILKFQNLDIYESTNLNIDPARQC